MKRLYTLLFAVIFMSFGRAWGQSLVITPSDTFSYSGAFTNTNDHTEQNGFIQNNTADTVNIYWHVLSVTEDSSWQMSFCDINNCYYYSIGLDLGNYGLNHFIATPHGSYRITFGATPYCQADSGKMVITTWIGGDSAATSQTLYYSANYTGNCVSAIQSVSAARLSIYPNPVSSVLTIDGLAGLKSAKLTIYDVLGNVACQKHIEQPSGAATINTSNLQAGVYFVTVDGDGTRLLTRRIQKLD